MSNLAMVLTENVNLPSMEAFVDAFAELAGDQASLVRGSMEKHEDEDSGTALSFADSAGGRYMLVPMPAAVPDGEADQAAEYSVAALGSDWTLPEHGAHFVVTSAGEDPVDGDAYLADLMRFTWVLAAFAKVSGAVGVYWGGAGATHPADFFVEWAGGENMPIPLWSGVSIAGADEGRLSLLSLGGEVLGVPDLMIETPEDEVEGALGFLFDLLDYIAQRGEAIPAGETVGRSEEERFEVQHVPSPIEDDELVQFVSM